MTAVVLVVQGLVLSDETSKEFRLGIFHSIHSECDSKVYNDFDFEVNVFRKFEFVNYKSMRRPEVAIFIYMRINNE
jgi:hypothetical protein